MRRHVPAIILCLIYGIVVIACRTQPTLPHLQKTGMAENVPAYDSNGLPESDTTKYDSLFRRIIALENEVYVNPHTVKNIAPLLNASFDSSSGCFLVAGKGVPNKSLPEASWKQGRKIASSYDAKRWALYCKAWSLHSAVPFGSQISGEITYSRILLERLEGDTLFTLVSVPTGSIIEK